MKPSELVKAALKGSGTTTRYELWKLTGVPQPRLSEFESNAAWPTNNATRALAEAAGLPWAEVLAALEIEKAKDDQTRTAWGKALASIRSKAALVLVALCVVAVLAGGSVGVGFGGVAITATLWILWVSIIFIM